MSIFVLFCHIFEFLHEMGIDNKCQILCCSTSGAIKCDWVTRQRFEIC